MKQNIYVFESRGHYYVDFCHTDAKMSLMKLMGDWVIPTPFKVGYDKDKILAELKERNPEYNVIWNA